MWKKFLIFDIVMLTAVFITAVFWMFPTNTCGISTDTFATVDMFMDFISDKTVKTFDSAEALQSSREYHLNAITENGSYLHHELQIYIVEPVEMYIQALDTYEQTAWVLETIQGDSEPGDQIAIFTVGGVKEQDGQAVFIGNYGKNFMIPGNQYLVFCEAIEIQTDSYKRYRTIYGLMNVLKLNADDSEFSDGYHPAYQWEQFKEREFLTYSNDALSEFNSLKLEVFESLEIDLEKYRK